MPLSVTNEIGAQIDRLNATLRTSDIVETKTSIFVKKRKLEYTLTGNANAEYVKATKLGLSGNGHLAALVTQTFAQDQARCIPHPSSMCSPTVSSRLNAHYLLEVI